MAKEKIFTPEDFDKPKDKNFWQKYKGWILGIAALFIVVAIVLYCIFCNIIEQNEAEVTKKEHVAINSESTVALNGTEDEEIETIQDAQEVANVEYETSTIKVEDSQEPEIRQENTSAKREAHTPTVSSNVEQEAMNVIRGDYGNVPERREKLGNKYQEIQNRVNQLKKEGAF